jgi:hypothetical protein
LELWGGLECSFVRVGADIRNQIIETGHYERAGDLHLAELGIETLRYPMLWDGRSPGATTGSEMMPGWSAAFVRGLRRSGSFRPYRRGSAWMVVGRHAE